MAYTTLSSLSSSSSDSENLEKAEKERHELKLILEKLQISSKSLNTLLESQVSDKDKTGLEYKAASPAVEGELHAPKRDLRFIDEHFKSVSVDVISNTAPSDVKTVDVNYKGVFSTEEPKPIMKNSFTPPIIEDWHSDDETCYVCGSFEHLQYDSDQKVVKPMWNNTRRVNHKSFANKFTHPHPKRRFVSPEVLTRLGKINTASASINIVARPVNTAGSKSTVNHPRLISNAFQRGSSQVIRPFNNGEAKLKLKELMELCTKLSDRVLDLEKIKTAQAKKIVALKKKVKKLEEREAKVNAASEYGCYCLKLMLIEDRTSRLMLRSSRSIQLGSTSVFQVLVKHHTSNGYQFTMSNRHQELTSPEQTISGKDLANPLIANSLLKTICAKRTAWNEFSCSMASAVICLATGRKFNFSKYIFDSMVRNVDSPSKFLMYPRFLQVVLDHQMDYMTSHNTRYTSLTLTQKEQPTTTFESSMSLLTTLMETCATLSQKVVELEQDKHSQALKILQLKKRVKKLEKKKKSKSSGLKRLRRVGGKIAAIDADKDITLVDVEKDEEEVTVVVPTIFDDEDVIMTMAQTLIKIKAEKAKLLDEQIAERLHDEEVQKAAVRDKQKKADLERALKLQKQYDDKE
nr:synaptobrevin, longin-like domain protein [Tanacetum cinerariifolium]